MKLQRSPSSPSTSSSLSFDGALTAWRSPRVGHRSGAISALATLLLVALAGLSQSCSEGKQQEKKTQKKKKLPTRRPPGLDSDKQNKSAAAKAISQRILFKRAMDAQTAGEVDQAMSLFAKAALKVPSSKLATRSHLAMGQLWDSKGEHQRALAAYGKALALDESNVAALHAMALAYEAAGKNKKAWEVFLKARALQKEDLTLCADGARIALAAGRQKKALELLSEFETRRDGLIETVVKGVTSKKETTKGSSKKTTSPGEPSSADGSKPRPLSRKLKRALEELAAVPDAKTARSLWPLLEAERSEIRKEVARILGQFRYEESLPTLKKALKKEKKKEVKEALRQAVGAINSTPRSFPEEVPSPRADRPR